MYLKKDNQKELRKDIRKYFEKIWRGPQAANDDWYSLPYR